MDTSRLLCNLPHSSTNSKKCRWLQEVVITLRPRKQVILMGNYDFQIEKDGEEDIESGVADDGVAVKKRDKKKKVKEN